ncbi:MAG: hypothetical protein H6536_00055 [Bacteroidales bacterium]|nr:hypothetical protein [Bacteroidales bacterium]
MENISIKVHPPWYARGTPIINTRDGPPMAESDIPLFAICEGPSARGKTIKCMNEKGKRVRSGLDFIRLWLTLNTTFFNTKKSVFSQQYARICQLADETIMERTKIENSQTRRVETIIENSTKCNPKTRRVETIIAMAQIISFQTRRVETIIENDMLRKPKIRRVETIIKLISSCNFKTQRVAMIIANDMLEKPKTQRVEKIIDEKNQWQKYHPVGVSDLHRLSCYNHNIPLGLKTKTHQWWINMIVN